MSKVIRNEFMGSWFLFTLLCLTIAGIPLAILYLLSGTIRVETEMAAPEEFIAAFRAGRVQKTN